MKEPLSKIKSCLAENRSTVALIGYIMCYIGSANPFQIGKEHNLVAPRDDGKCMLAAAHTPK